MRRGIRIFLHALWCQLLLDPGRHGKNHGIECFRGARGVVGAYGVSGGEAGIVCLSIGDEDDRWICRCVWQLRSCMLAVETTVKTAGAEDIGEELVRNIVSCLFI